MELNRARPHELTGAVVAQSLDNQWVSGDLTRRMVRSGSSLRDVAEVRDKEGRAEYFRGLINTRTLVVNRAFFYNNSVINRDLLVDGPARRAHQRLLAEAALVPYLLWEREPTDPPPGVNVVDDAFAAWRETVAGIPTGSRVTCARLSWDEGENRRLAQSALFGEFAGKVQGLTAKEQGPLASDLGVKPEQVEFFRDRLHEVVAFSNDQRRRDQVVNRGLLYEQFVTVPGSAVSEGRYDKNKPFAAEIKQLLDLVYNVNLADALKMYPLTPADSLRRLVLQEYRDVNVSPDRTITDPEQLATLLGRQTFAAVQDHLTVDDLDALALEDICELREKEAWHRYLDAFDVLMDDPLAMTADPARFGERIHLVFDRYVGLNAEIVRLAKARRALARESQWKPVVEMVVTLGQSVVTAMYGDGGWTLLGEIGPMPEGVIGGTVQLILRNGLSKLSKIHEGRQQQRFAREMASVRFDSRRELSRFLDHLRSMDGYREERSEAQGATTTTATTQDHTPLPEY